MPKIYSLIIVCVALTSCVTAGRDEFYASIDEYLQLSQSCYRANGFTECTVPLIKRTLEPTWVNYDGDGSIFKNFYSRVDDITNQKDNGQINSAMADKQYSEASSALLAAIQSRDAARLRRQERIANALAGAAQYSNSHSLGEAVMDNKVYSADECIGPVIMGRCHGSVIDKGGYHPTCHGEWLNGHCTGPMF